MKVFKFGGASVKDASGVRNLVRVLETVGFNDTFVVVSAMGKTTNALENIIKVYFEDKESVIQHVLALKEFHLKIVEALFENQFTKVNQIIHDCFEELNTFLKNNKAPNYSFVYDQVVSYGELLSTTIIHHYFEFKEWKSFWLDARACIKTDDYYRSANLNWDQTQEYIKTQSKGYHLIVTQSSLGRNSHKFTPP